MSKGRSKRAVQMVIPLDLAGARAVYLYQIYLTAVSTCRACAVWSHHHRSWWWDGGLHQDGPADSDTPCENGPRGSDASARAPHFRSWVSSEYPDMNSAFTPAA
jgi:hypothetical protein